MLLISFSLLVVVVAFFCLLGSCETLTSFMAKADNVVDAVYPVAHCFIEAAKDPSDLLS